MLPIAGVVAPDGTSTTLNQTGSSTVSATLFNLETGVFTVWVKKSVYSTSAMTVACSVTDSTHQSENIGTVNEPPYIVDQLGTLQFVVTPGGVI